MIVSGRNRRARSTVRPYVVVNSRKARYERTAPALDLESQEPDDVGPLERLVKVRRRP